MASQNIVELTDSNFDQEVVQGGLPALVDFWAEWCMPCRMIAPTVEEIATEYAGRVKVGKIDTDNNREVSLKFGISAIPTIILFKDGQPVKKLVGLQSKKDIKAAVESLL